MKTNETIEFLNGIKCGIIFASMLAAYGFIFAAMTGCIG